MTLGAAVTLALGLVLAALLHAGLYQTVGTEGVIYRINRVTGTMIACGWDECVPVRVP